MKAIRLRTEYLNNPIGIDIAKPRLFWNCEDGVTQTAYQIIAECYGKTVWDSGKTVTSQMTHIPYGGKVVSRTRVEWKVRLWDEGDKPGDWSETAVFEMGLLRACDWKAKWIAGNYQVDKKRRYPVDCFRKSFDAKDIAKARIYATACGIYEGCLNGKRLGDFIPHKDSSRGVRSVVLAPGHTDYRKRIQYQTYDVTDLLLDGENELTFQLADGWYRGSCGAWGLKNQYGTETKLLVQLEMTHKDGSMTRVCTDSSWQWSNDGEVRFADNKDGEKVDANRVPSYSGAAKITSCDVVPTASNNVPVTEHETFKPKLIMTPSGKKVLDFGQNIAGYCSFVITAKKGQKIRLRFGEMLDADGEFTQKNIQCSNQKITTPLQQVLYLCKEGCNEYKTRFAIFGFQYVLVETNVSFEPKDFTAIAVYSDLETTARFESSNKLLNQFVENTLWSAKNNSADVPTDCPTRERHGWTGDSQLFAVTAGYLMNYMPFARKHIRDLTDWQRKDGAFPQIAPYGGVDSYMNTLNGSVGWADAGVLIPYRYWKLFGDVDFIRENYDAMAKYARFMIRRCGKTGLFAKPLGIKGTAKKFAVNTGQSYGEWAEPEDVYPNHWTDMVAPHPEVSTAYTAYVMGVMEEIAEALGKAKDIPLYRKYKEGCRAAYQAMAQTPKYTLDTDRQACLVRPLYFGLLNEKQTKYARKRLLQALKHYHWRVGTGFLSTPLILYVLSDIDLEAAYRLLENEEMPGWLFMPKAGATTIWESWEGTQAQGGIASLNHYSKGACCEWVFRIMCGIQVDGENHFTIAPRPGGHFTNASLDYDTVYGTVSCAWRKENGRLIYTVTVPANTTAALVLPGGTKQELTAGSYSFEEAICKSKPVGFHITKGRSIMDSKAIVSKMTLEDKISLCTGADFWRSKKMEQYGVPSFTMSDGPHGLRYQSGETDMIGVNQSAPATCFPTAVTAGATWNPELYAAEGKAIGEEAVKYGVDVVLGPGCNIKRNPLCGRNFEYLSEDPYIAGKMAAAFIREQQSVGVSSSLKHFAANNQEYKRQNGDSQVDGRALREIYLAPFETAVKEGKPGTVMCSYNKINGVHASDNKWLLTDVLRGEWGFDGMVVTDWGALSDRIEAYKAGCDLNMPGGSTYMEKDALEAVKNGTLSVSDIDATVERIIHLALRSAKIQKGGGFDEDAHDKLACTVAEQGAVLLKNDSHVLPAKAEDMVLIGDMAKNFRYQGAGSSHINPIRLTSLTDALPKVPYFACCDADGKVTEPALREAAEAAKKVKIAVVVAGLPDSYESEGFDRENMKMPEGHNRMIEAVAAANPNTVVVLLGGSAMELPWFDKVKAILYMGLSGQAGGQACANLLTGRANPCGKLTETWPLRYGDVVSKDTFGKQDAEYRESIYVGYRYYDKASVAVRFPFGHGLSYTEFAYSDLQVDERTVTATIANTGSVPGAEVVQLYIAPPQNGIHRPVRELKGFVRVELKPGESRQVTFNLDDRCFAVWEDGWKVPGGNYEVLLAASSRDIRLCGFIEVAGEALKILNWQSGSWYETLSGKPSRVEWEKVMGHSVAIIPEAKKGQFTMDNSCLEMKGSSFIMKIQYKVTESIIAKSFGGKKDYTDPAFKMMMVCATDCPLRATIISSGGTMSDSLARGLLEMANGHYIRGVRAMLEK